MTRYAFKEAVNYPPWIGSSYGTKGSKRILIVGQNYNNARFGNRSISDYIRYLIKTGKEDPFFNPIEYIASSKEHWKQSFGKVKLDRKKFWNSVSYYQFLQGIQEDPFSDPTRKMWKQGQDIFKKAVLELDPQIILIFSFDVFDNIPTMGGRKGEEFTSGRVSLATWDFQMNGHPSAICRLMNPRKSSFYQRTWKELYDLFLEDYIERYGKVYL